MSRGTTFSCRLLLCKTSDGSAERIRISCSCNGKSRNSLRACAVSAIQFKSYLPHPPSRTAFQPVSRPLFWRAARTPLSHHFFRSDVFNLNRKGEYLSSFSFVFIYLRPVHILMLCPFYKFIMQNQILTANIIHLLSTLSVFIFFFF